MPQNRSRCCEGQNVFIEIRSPHRLSRSLFATLRNTDHEIILQGEELLGMVRGLLTLVETNGLLLEGARDFHIFHSVHFNSVTIN